MRLRTMADLEEGQGLLDQVDAVGDADHDDGVGTGVWPLEEIIHDAALFGEQFVDFVNTENAVRKNHKHPRTEAPSCVMPS